jgi:uncharacterized protein YecT (DUF1311 family)
MSKAGGIVGLLAGIFGFFAAIITLFIGGVGAAFHAEKAHSIVGLGWGGILFSFLAIVFAAVSLAKPKLGGYGLIAAAVLGAFLGGTFVAVCMALAVVGGILAVVGAPKTSTEVVAEESVKSLAPSGVASGSFKMTRWSVVVVGLVAVLAIMAIIGVGSQSKPAVSAPLVQLEGEAVSELEPFGELSEMFALGSSNTKLQRENKLKEITGKVVHWDLPIYEVARAGNGYKIQTESGNLVGAFVMISPRSEEERKLIGGLKTGDQLSFKGRITGSSLRSLNIEPAILVAGKNGLSTGASAQSRMIAGLAQLKAQMAAPRITSEHTTPVAPAASVTPVAVLAPVVAITPVAVVSPQTAIPDSLARPSSSGDFAPSYDCQKASTGSERLICSSRELSALDVELSQAYGRRLDDATDKISLKTDQVKWRKNVRDACSTGECMAKAYRERIDDFVAQSQYLSKPAQFR